MPNFVIKRGDRKERENQILKEFGCNPNNASKEDREKAEYIAEKAMQLNR